MRYLNIKRLIKNTLLTVTAAAILVCGMPQLGQLPEGDYAYGATTPPVLESNGGIAIDYHTGEVLYAKNENSQFEPASMTKMMTCILALENLQLTDIVTIDQETSFTGGSRIYLLEDEQITVQNLLYALMLESANDSAVALAKAVAGTVPDFAKMMNKKAKELGCTGTNFVNPNGLHEEGHLSTPHDMALIAQYCMHNETFRELCTTYKYTIPQTNKQPERYLYNTNRLIYDTNTKINVNGVTRTCKYDGCIGIKTGYTPQAGGCLTSGVQKGDTEIITVVMNGTDKGRFADTIALFDWVLANYHSEKAAAFDTNLGAIPVKGGAYRQVPVMVAEEAYVLLPSEASSSVIRTEAVYNEDITAPLEKGAKVGKLEVYMGDQLMTSVDIVTTKEMKKGTVLSYVGIENKQAYIIIGIIGVLLILFIVFFVWIRVEKARRRRERIRRREEKAMQLAKERADREADQQLRDWFFQ